MTSDSIKPERILNDVDAFDRAFIDLNDRLGRYDDTDRDAAEIAALLELAPGARVLDAACGTGRMGAALQALGYEVVGADISREVIAEAQRRSPGPQYIVADLTKPLELPPFDAVVNTYSSWGYGKTVEDDQQMLRVWNQALKPGGRLVMELSDLERSRHRLGTSGDVVTRVTNDVEEKLWVDWATGMLHVTYSLDGVSVPIQIRMYEREDLQRMVSEAGFRDVLLYGGYDRHEKRPEDRAVVVATR
jgi:SAM-dependent methyltransferase